MKKPFVLLWGGIAAVILFVWVYVPALSRYQDLKTREEGVDIQTRNLQKKVQDLREEKDLLKNDPGYLEKVIREEMGLVKPGEIVYKFVEDKPPAPSPASSETPAEAKTQNPPQSSKPAPAISVQAKKVEESADASKKETADQTEGSGQPPINTNTSAEPEYPRRETR